MAQEGFNGRWHIYNILNSNGIRFTWFHYLLPKEDRLKSGAAPGFEYFRWRFAPVGLITTRRPRFTHPRSSLEASSVLSVRRMLRSSALVIVPRLST